MPLKLIGAGLGRTGTASTRKGLQLLGLTKVYHFHEIRGSPNQEELFLKWIQAFQLKEQNRITECKAILYELVNDYDATLDHPACHFYKELGEMYPEAVILLNLRDSHESYVKSVSNTIGKIAELVSSNRYQMVGNFCPISPTFKELGRYFWTMPGVEFHNKVFTDPTYLEKYYEWWNAKVINECPSDRLWIFNVKQGWEPICRALKIEKPSFSFPYVNTTETMRQNINRLQKVLYGIYVIILSIFVLFSSEHANVFSFGYDGALVLITLLLAFKYVILPLGNMKQVMDFRNSERSVIEEKEKNL